MKRLTPSKWFKLALGAALITVAGLTGYWHYASPASTCARCHEVSPAHSRWTTSAHRDMRCEACHGTAFSRGLHSLIEKGNMALTHFTEDDHEMRLNEAQVLEISSRCQPCHQKEYAGWLASGHSLKYRDVFLNETHNTGEMPINDCLRCHGMFFEGRIEDVVEPLDRTGPWRMVNAEQGDKPAIPCLACHSVHRDGARATSPDYARPDLAAAGRGLQASPAGLFLRRERAFLPISELPSPQMLEGAREVAMSSDSRQRLCYQCHAPEITRQAGTSDDRTPLGVHEGLSCFSCHTGHSMDASQSCVLCHPKLSNCGLDVIKMDTTASSPSSPHNIHRVACADCHKTGVPPTRHSSGHTTASID